MSYYNKPDRNALPVPLDGEKRVFVELVSAELKSSGMNAAEHLQSLKSGLRAGQKQSSATLLRRKLKGSLVRELQEI
jgi:hypothetical protein